MEKPQSDDERRKRDIDYQENRKKKLEQLGENKVTARLDKITHKRLANLCENLGYPRPEAKKRNLVEIYSIAITHLINREFSILGYNPKSPVAKELYQLHKIVSHLRHDEYYSDNEIIEKMKNDKRRTPRALLNEDTSCNWTDKSIILLIDEKKVIKKIHELDNIAPNSISSAD